MNESIYCTVTFTQELIKEVSDGLTEDHASQLAYQLQQKLQATICRHGIFSVREVSKCDRARPLDVNLLHA